MHEKIISAMMEKDHFSQWLGVEILESKPGFCAIKMLVKQEMLNGFGILHGGVCFAFADSCLAFASNSRGVLSVSLQATMSFPAKAFEGEFLIATSHEISLSRTTGIYDVEVKKETDNALVGLFRGIIHRSNKPAPGLEQASE